jgi:hypothetical protein
MLAPLLFRLSTKPCHAVWTGRRQELCRPSVRQAAEMFAPDHYVAVLRFAASRHAGQTVPGTELPYVVHITSAAEVIAVGLGDPAVTCALLHDVIEDTTKTEPERAAADLGAVRSRCRRGCPGPHQERNDPEGRPDGR